MTKFREIWQRSMRTVFTTQRIGDLTPDELLEWVLFRLAAFYLLIWVVRG